MKKKKIVSIEEQIRYDFTNGRRLTTQIEIL